MLSILYILFRERFFSLNAFLKKIRKNKDEEIKRDSIHSTHTHIHCDAFE